MIFSYFELTGNVWPYNFTVFSQTIYTFFILFILFYEKVCVESFHFYVFLSAQFCPTFPNFSINLNLSLQVITSFLTEEYNFKRQTSYYSGMNSSHLQWMMFYFSFHPEHVLAALSDFSLDLQTALQDGIMTFVIWINDSGLFLSPLENVSPVTAPVLNRSLAVMSAGHWWWCYHPARGEVAAEE